MEGFVVCFDVDQKHAVVFCTCNDNPLRRIAPQIYQGNWHLLEIGHCLIHNGQDWRPSETLPDHKLASSEIQSALT